MTIANARDLSDRHWRTLDELIPEPPRRKDGRGRPWKDRRAVLNRIPWVLRTDAPLGGFAGPLSVVPDLPSPISTVGALRSDESPQTRKMFDNPPDGETTSYISCNKFNLLLPWAS